MICPLAIHVPPVSSDMCNLISHTVHHGGSGSETQGVIRRVQKEPLVRLGARLRSQGALSDQVVKEIQLKVRRPIQVSEFNSSCIAGFEGIQRTAIN